MMFYGSFCAVIAKKKHAENGFSALKMSIFSPASGPFGARLELQKGCILDQNQDFPTEIRILQIPNFVSLGNSFS